MHSTALVAAAAAATLPLLTAAHFKMEFPAQRDADESRQGTYPCSGASSPSQKRTPIPLRGQFPIQLDLEHTTSNIQVLLALSDNPTGNDFGTVLVPTLAETGPEDFCIGGVSIPRSLNVRPGQNGTILVATNAHGAGGLYNCADVVFVDTVLAQSEYGENCKNSTGVSAKGWGSVQGNANGTVAAATVNPAATSASSGAGESATGASPSAASSAGAGSKSASDRLAVGMGVLSAGLLAGMMAMR